MHEPGKVVIVCYTFPPMSGVGGRRWVKFARILTHRGWKVTVISGKPKENEESSWDEDALNLKVVRLPNLYPGVLNRPPRNIFDKIRYRLSLLALRFFTNANYYDRGIFWKNQFSKVVERELNHLNTRNLIVSGGPFSLLYFGSELKKKIPQLNFIADIRDHWMKDEFYGFGLLSEKRKIAEQMKLQTVLNVADRIFVPYPEMMTHYKQLSKCEDRLNLLPHAVDLSKVIKKNRRDSYEPLKLVNFGSIHTGMDLLMTTLAQEIHNCNFEIKINFYSAEEKYIDTFRLNGVLGSHINYCKPVDEKRVFGIMAGSSAVVVFIPEHFKNNISTKFMEIIASATPIVTIGYRGDVSRFIEDNKLGIHIATDEIGDKLPALKEKLENLNYNENFKITEFTFEYQTNLLEEMLTKERDAGK